jgi:N-acetylneuraminic acid mutarotase
VAARGLLAGLLAVLGTAGVVAAAGLDAGLSRTDRWRPLRPASLERTEVSAARIDRSIYVIGGFEAGSVDGSRSVERYDIGRNRWSRVRPMPLGVNHSTATAYRGRLYVHGGYAGRGLSEPTAALLEYNPHRNRWRRLRSSPTPRAAHAAAVIGDSLYVAGGADDSGSLKSMEVFHFPTRRWRGAPSFPGPARNHMAGVAVGGHFYVIGGRDQSNLRVVERYNTVRRRWQRLPDLRTARGGIAAAQLSGRRIVVFGGENLEPGGTTIAPVEMFDVRARRWRRLPDMRTPRHGLGGAGLGNRAYAVEGGPEPGLHYSRAIEYLDVR